MDLFQAIFSHSDNINILKNEYVVSPFLILLQYGADINTKNNYGNTALHDAIELEQMELIHFLIKNGANVNSINNFKMTEIIPLLLNDGASR